MVRFCSHTTTVLRSYRCTLPRPRTATTHLLTTLAISTQYPQTKHQPMVFNRLTNNQSSINHQSPSSINNLLSLQGPRPPSPAQPCRFHTLQSQPPRSPALSGESVVPSRESTKAPSGRHYSSGGRGCTTAPQTSLPALLLLLPLLLVSPGPACVCLSYITQTFLMFTIDIASLLV